MIDIPPGDGIVKIASVTPADEAVHRAIMKAWDRLMAEDKRIPPVVGDLTPGRSSSCSSVGWRDIPILEVNLRPDGRNLTGPEMMAWLLHQAAHGVVGPTKTSEGRFHSPAYGQAAVALGLDVERLPGLGHSETTLAAGTKTRYRSEIAALDRALSRWEPTEQIKAERQARNGVVLECSCTPPRKIRMRGNPDKIDTAGILCQICGEPFTLA